MRFSFWDRPDLARLSRLLMPPGGWNIPRKKKWRYLWRVLLEDRKRGLIQPSRYTANLGFWTDGGDYQVPNNVRSPELSYPPHFRFWTDGTDWVDAPEAIDNAEEWELLLQAMSRLERLKVRLQLRYDAKHYPLRDDIIMEPSPRYERFAYFQNRELFRGYRAKAKGPFVIESDVDPRLDTGWEHYRCTSIFEGLIYAGAPCGLTFTWAPVESLGFRFRD